MAGVNNNENNSAEVQEKKKFPKKYLIIAAVVLFIIMMIAANNHAKEKEEAAKGEESATVTDVDTGEDEEETQLSDAELEQQALIEVYGEPPQGFRWDDDGNTIPISNEGLTDEEVGMQYLRALTTLNMETAQKYAYYSTVISAYNSYYTIDASESYYTQFQRQVLTTTLQQTEIIGMENKVIFANGRRIITYTLTLPDLSYKDWYLDKAEEIYENMHTYLTGESDSVKAQQYVFSEVLNYLKSGNAKTKTVSVDITLDKVTNGGWVVTDDTSLDMVCEYRDGTSTYEYIFEQYTNWADAKYR